MPRRKFRLKVDGQWLSRIGPYGPVTVTHSLHGFEEASWEMQQGLVHPRLRGNALVEVYNGGIRIGRGSMIEPDQAGRYVAKGEWRQAEIAPAINASGGWTSSPQDVITQGLARGDLTWSGSGAAFSATPYGDPLEQKIATVLDNYTAELGTRWAVDANSGPYFWSDPSSPKWKVPHAVYGRSLTPAEDDFYTHIVGNYLTSASTYTSATVGSAAAAALWGRRTAVVDLTPAGVIGATRATSILSGIFLLSGARLGFAERLTLAYGQIASLGGTPAPLAQVMAGQKVRLAGTIDPTLPGGVRTYTDIIIAESVHTDGSNEITITPVGYAPRDFASIVERTVGAAA